jgi:HlyD family secretion protein
METGTTLGTPGTESVLPQRSPKGKKLLIGGIAVVVVLGAAIAGIVKATSGGPGIPNSQIYQIAYASTASSIATQGTVVAKSEINLDFQGQGGTVKKVLVKVGDHVKAGQVLATLDDSLQTGQVAQAEAGVAVAQGQLAEAQAHAQQLIAGPSAQTVGVSKSAVQAAQTALINAKKNFADQRAAYNDRTAAHQQLVAAQNAVSQASAALQTAKANQDSQTSSAQQSLQTAENNLATDQKNLEQAKTQYGDITEDQVQQAYSTYLNELSAYQGYQQGPFGGGANNPYAASLAADQNVYQTLNQGYNALQTAQKQYDGDLAAVQSAKSGITGVQNSIATAQAQYDAAEKGLQEAQAAYDDRTGAKQALDASANAVAQAQSSVNTAQAQLSQTTQPPQAQDLNAAQAAVQTAQGGVQAAQAQLQQAQTGESYTILKAPADGVVTQKNTDIGELASPNQPAFVLDVNEIQVNIPISEAQLNDVTQGDKIKLTVPELPGQTLAGQIIQVDPTPIPNNPGNYKAVATLDGTSSKAVRPGMTGNVTVYLGHDPHVLTIPSTSLQTVGGVQGVYMVGTAPGKAGAGAGSGSGSGAGTTGSSSGAGTSANTAQNVNLPKGVYFQPVQVGIVGSTTAQIVGGLKPGEKILLGEGQFLVSSNGTDLTAAEDGNS